MSKMYIHVWHDSDGVELIMEQTPIFTINDAIDGYNQQWMNAFPYKHTIVLDGMGNTFEFIDIRQHIALAKEELESYEALTFNDRQYLPRAEKEYDKYENEEN